MFKSLLKSKLRLAVWICNAVIALMCLFAVISYFFMPYWSINVSYTVQGDMLQDMIGEDVEIDTSAILGDDGLELGISLSFETSVLLQSFGDEGEAVSALVEDNVDTLVEQLTSTLSKVIEKTVRSFASSLVGHEVTKNIKDMLTQLNPSISDEEVSRRLENIGITDKFISEKTNAIIDKLYSEGSTVDGLCDEIVNTVGEVYSKIAAGTDADLQDAQFTDEQKAELREAVTDVLGELAAEDGSINANELLASLLINMLDSMEDSDENNSDNSYNNYALAPAPNGDITVGALNASGEHKESATARLKAKARDFLMSMIPDDIYDIVAWVMRGMAILYFFSSFWWVYIIIKLIVKTVKFNTEKVQKNPTVKLKAPIWLGWLPFFILVLVPSIAMSFVMDMIAGDMGDVMGAINISFSSAGIVAFIFAIICFGISIFYIVARKKFKAEAAYANAPASEERDEMSMDEPAPAGDTVMSEEAAPEAAATQDTESQDTETFE